MLGRDVVGEVPRLIDREGLHDQALAPAELGGRAVHHLVDLLPALHRWTEQIGQRHVVATRPQRLRGLRVAARERLERPWYSSLDSLQVGRHDASPGLSTRPSDHRPSSGRHGQLGARRLASPTPARAGSVRKVGAAGLQRLAAVRVAVQPDVGVAEPGEQVVVEPPDGARGIAVPHGGGDGRAVDVPQRRAELVEGGDAQLEQEPRDPLVVLGPGPACARVAPREEGRELRRADPRVEGVTGVDAAVPEPGLEPVPDRTELAVRELERPAARVNRRSRSGTCSGGTVPL